MTVTVAIQPNATFGELRNQIPLSVWQAMPTLCSGQTDDLKYESPHFRVWVSRMTLKDYDGDSAVYLDERLTIEHSIDGVWVRLDKYGRPNPY